MKEVFDNTLIRVSVQERILSTGQWEEPQLFCIAPWKHLHLILKTRHPHEAALRTRRELDAGIPLVQVYVATPGYQSHTCYTLQFQENAEALA